MRKIKLSSVSQTRKMRYCQEEPYTEEAFATMLIFDNAYNKKVVYLYKRELIQMRDEIEKALVDLEQIDELEEE